MEGILHGGIAQVVEELHAVHTQHDRKIIGRPALLAWWVIMRGDLIFQAVPGNERLHAFQEQLTPGLAFLFLGSLFLVWHVGKGHLSHESSPLHVVDYVIIISAWRGLIRGFLILPPKPEASDRSSPFHPSARRRPADTAVLHILVLQHQALLTFRETYNATWLLEHHGFRPSAAIRSEQLPSVAEMAWGRRGGSGGGAVQNDPDDFLPNWTAAKDDSIYVLSYH